MYHFDTGCEDGDDMGELDGVYIVVLATEQAELKKRALDFGVTKRITMRRPSKGPSRAHDAET